MGRLTFGSLASAGLLAFLLLETGPPARADLVISATVGGAPSGEYYANFDNLSLGQAGGVSDGITVSFSGNAQAVQGSLSGRYAAPYLSNNNGVPFGDPSNGPDSTTYLSTGIGSVTLTMPTQETYIGLLWGSVDGYNSLHLYNGSTLVGTITGTQVTASANGNQGANGTYYVNIQSTQGFDKVVATSSSYAFEFDNVAFNAMSAVPEPSSFVLAMAGAIGMIAASRLRRKRSSIAARS